MLDQLNWLSAFRSLVIGSPIEESDPLLRALRAALLLGCIERSRMRAKDGEQDAVATSLLAALYVGDSSAPSAESRAPSVTAEPAEPTPSAAIDSEVEGELDEAGKQGAKE